MSPDVAVVGAGISGLTAAYELHTRGARVVVLEARTRAGGVILTERVDDFTVEGGPDSLLVQKPAGLELCRELGLADRLVRMRHPRTAYILRGGRLRPVPEGSVLGVPIAAGALVRNRVLSWPGRLRMSLEPWMPRRDRAVPEESIADFFQRRFGRESVTYVAEPLLAGIHTGDVHRLSIDALFPNVVDAEREHGSVLRAFRRLDATSSRDGPFRTFPNGIRELVDALLGALPEDAVRCGAEVHALAPGSPIRIALGDGAIEAGAVILAIPAFAVATLARSFDTELATLCEAIPYTSSACIALGYRRDAIHHPLAGTGFVVPRVERDTRITAATWTSSKWPDRAPAGRALVRAFFGSVRTGDLMELDDAALTCAAHEDLRRLLRIDGSPLLRRVYRWPRANPQYELGHLSRIEAIEHRLARHPALFVTSSGFRGIGIPDCIADARRVAARALEAARRV